MSPHQGQSDYDRISMALDGQQRFPFILVAGPAGIGKRRLVHRVIHDRIGPRIQSDLLHIRDLTEQIGKSHILPVKQPGSDTSASYKLSDGTIYDNIGAREIRDRLVRSSHSGTKIVYIEHIERATTSAANALLKHLEEPLPGRYIIATTSSLDDVLMTLRSRALTIGLQGSTAQQIIDELTSQYDLPQSQAKQIVYLSAAKSEIAHDLASHDDLPQILSTRETLLLRIQDKELIPLLESLRSIDSSLWPLYRDALIQHSIDEGEYLTVDALIRHHRYRTANVQADNALVQLAMDIVHKSQ